MIDEELPTSKHGVSHMRQKMWKEEYHEYMATGKKIPTIESKALSIAIKRAMTTRELKVKALAQISGVPYGTLRRILELNTVADYEQLQRIAKALRMPLPQIIEDADQIGKDPGVIAEFEASREEIDIDAWANRIKAEGSIMEGTQS